MIFVIFNAPHFQRIAESIAAELPSGAHSHFSAVPKGFKIHYLSARCKICKCYFFINFKGWICERFGAYAKSLPIKIKSANSSGRFLKFRVGLPAGKAPA
jgi:hypothetical protein